MSFMVTSPTMEHSLVSWGSRVGWAAALLVVGTATSPVACSAEKRNFDSSAGMAGDGTQDGGGIGLGGATGGGGGEGGGNTTCIDVVLDGNESSGESTAQEDDVHALSCASGSAPDLAFAWTAPLTDYYAFSTAGSGFDTVVAVLDDCDGAELACNNNHRGSPQGVAVARVEAGQTVVVVVDGNVGDRGSVALSIEPVTCPSSDVTSQPLPAVFTTVGGPDDHDGADSGYDCSVDGTVGGQEKTIRWVAPEDGLFRFSVVSEDFGPGLYLYLGAACGGPPVQCNRNVASGYAAEITRWLDAGQAVTAVVESDDTGGEFTFDVTQLTPETCPNPPPLANVTDVTLDWDTASFELSSSCTWAGSDTQEGHFPEHSYAFTVDLAPAVVCTVSVDVAGPAAAYLLRGNDCRGEELDCTDSVAPATFNFVGTDDNGDYVLVVENQHAFGGPVTYSIQTNCVTD